MHVRLFPVAVSLLFSMIGAHAPAAPPAGRTPIIDMHLHAVPPGRGRTPGEMLADMDSSGISIALLMANDEATLELWRKAAPERFIMGVVLPCPGGKDPNLASCFSKSHGWPDVTWIQAQVAAGRLKAIGEVYYVYYGLNPADPRLEPYWQAAESLDIPVIIIHTGRRPVATLPSGCCSGYNDDLGRPSLLEPVLNRHPKLRVSLAHVGQPRMMEETIALMKAHPNVYGDLSVVNSRAPMAGYSAVIDQFKRARLLNRLFYGSDNEDFGKTIARTEALTNLSDSERRAILCDNAAHFLRLSASVCEARTTAAAPRLAASEIAGLASRKPAMCRKPSRQLWGNARRSAKLT